MEPDELKKILEDASKSISTQASEMASKSASEAATNAVKVVKDEYQKSLEKQGVEIKNLSDSVEKLSKHIEVSFKDIGASSKQIEKALEPKSKAKIFRGIVTNNWGGAEQEKTLIDAVQQKAIEAGDFASGGAILPNEFSQDIVRLVRNGEVFQRLGCTMVSPTRQIFNIPKILSGSTAYMVGEGKNITESDMKFGLVNLTPRKAAALVYASREMLNAADPAIIPIIEQDMAEALVELQMQMALYGNGGANEPVGLFNQAIPSANRLADGATGDSPTQAFFRKLRSKVAEKYNAENMKFLVSRNTSMKAASVLETAVGDAAILLTDDQKAERTYGMPFVSSGLVRSNKTKSSGTNLSDVFYGNFAQMVVAQWWGGMRIDATDVGGDAWKQDLYGFRTILPFDIGVRDMNQFAIAEFVQTINS